MSNKTSDKNVANIEDSIMLLEEIINGDKECLEIDIRNNNYEDIEHWKREIKAVENVVNAYYREKARADKLENDYSKLLTETDEKDKRIQELGKQLQKYYNGELYTAKQLKNLENNQKKYFINKQVVIDKMEELNKEIKSCDEIDAIFKIKQQQVLQELLEGERK